MKLFVVVLLLSYVLAQAVVQDATGKEQVDLPPVEDKPVDQAKVQVALKKAEESEKALNINDAIAEQKAAHDKVKKIDDDANDANVALDKA